MEHLLVSRDIRKSFGSVKANNNISASFSSGRIYGLLGENGSGKTTFLNILFGIYKSDGGEISLDGKQIRLKSPKDAISNGIYLVQQNFSLIENFTVLENLALMEGSSIQTTNLTEIRDKVEKLTGKIGLHVDKNAIISDLPLSLRQRVEILRGLLYGANVLLLDEPTSVLGPNESEQLGDALRVLASEGRIIILTSHKLEQVFKLCTDFVVLRKGQLVFTGTSSEIQDAADLVRYMFGENLPEAATKAAITQKDKDVFKIQNLEIIDNEGKSIVKDVTFSLRPGQILGIAGVAGNGQKELAEAVAGLRRISKGSITLNSDDITNIGRLSVRRKGIGYIPEEGDIIGLVPDFTIAENLSLTDYDEANKSLLLDRKRFKEKAEALIKDYEITPIDKNTPIRWLSGGNKQKIMVARELSRQLELLVAYNASKGLDLKTTALVQKRILEKRETGTAIVLFSEDLEEIFALSDYIAVMSEGRIVALSSPDKLNTQMVGKMMSASASVSKS